MTDLHYKVEKKETSTTIFLRGDLVNDVRTSFESLEALFETRDLIFDCEGLGKINSIGVRHWLMFLDRISKAHDFRFRNCREGFMDTAIMIPGFTRNRPIDSFYTAITCSGCHNEKSVLFKVKKNKTVNPEAIICEKCGNAMETSENFDDHIAKFAS
jgi:hypothetical protein